MARYNARNKIVRSADFDERALKGGIDTLPPAGHGRREILKKRQDRLNAVAEGLVNNTDVPTYAIDPAKLKEEPEILKHYDFVNGLFEVSRPVTGKVYFWCRDDRQAIAQKQAEAKMWLGAGHRGWEIVGNCSCLSEHGKDCPFPEALEVKQVDGRRMIGDVFLMRIGLDEYTLIHKRMLLVVRYREGNPHETLTEFVRKYEGLVSVTEGNASPRDLYAKEHKGAPLIHTDRLTNTEP